MKIFFKEPVDCEFCHETDFTEMSGYEIKCANCGGEMTLTKNINSYEFEGEDDDENN